MKSHYSSNLLHWRCKQYSLAESLLLPVETVTHPTRLESETSEIACPFSQTAYN